MSTPLADALRPHGVAVLFADEHVAVFDKPSGLPSQGGRDGERGLIELLWASGFAEAALHHRLDQPASGALAVAMNKRANAGLARAFRDRTAIRWYRAVLAGPTTDTEWTHPLDGRDARTEVEVVGTGSGWSAVALRLHSGRTHQIRRHAALAGVPVVGDRRYGAEVGTAWPRLALHAWRLRLPHPVSGDAIEVEAPMAADLVPVWTLAGGP